MKGWFDAFRCDGGPTLYSFNNRTPVTGDVTIITCLTVFGTLYLAFLLIFPGIRKERFSTFAAVTLSLFVGAAILVCRFGSSWHVGSAIVTSSYRAFSKERITAELGAYVGLNHVNITLTGVSGNWTSGAGVGAGAGASAGAGVSVGAGAGADIDFNERFVWEAPGAMGRSYREALSRGLPFPILTVAEYFSLGTEGFSWGAQYRAAGYFATIMLWTSVACWVLMLLLLLVVPRYGACMLAGCGALLLTCALGYTRLLPVHPLNIHIEGATLHLSLGWSFWLVCIAGCLCLIAGVGITMMDLVYPHSFSTVLEVDYDTPYDRHVIIEDSHGRRQLRKKASQPKLEEPPGIGVGLGSRILRRLSSKSREGIDNQAFELDPPKSPWRYPFRTGLVPVPVPVPVSASASVSVSAARVDRSHSQDSASSMASHTHMPSVHRDIARTIGLRQPTDKLREVSMW